MMTWHCQCNGGRKSIVSTSRCGSKKPHLAESNNSRSRMPQSTSMTNSTLFESVSSAGMSGYTQFSTDSSSRRGSTISL